MAAAKNQKSLTSLSVQRTLKEASQLNGQLSISLTNNDDTNLDVLYLETMPWIVQFYLHTLVPRVNGVVQSKHYPPSLPGIRLILIVSSQPIFIPHWPSEPKGDAVSNISYIPAIPHSRPTTFQAVFRIPAKSTLLLTMDVTKAFLRYTEHPPDAQRGWDLPPAIIMPLTNTQNPQNPTVNSNFRPRRRLYTPTLLVDLATPDFSMPYNVIIFTCTLIAFIFGSIFAMLTRKFVVISLKDPPSKSATSTSKS